MPQSPPYTRQAFPALFFTAHQPFSVPLRPAVKPIFPVG